VNNCAFLVRGMCPNCTRSCNNPCEKYSIVGDDKKPIFQDWNNGIDKLAAELGQKYFGEVEEGGKDQQIIEVKSKELEDEEIEVIDDFLGEE